MAPLLKPLPIDPLLPGICDAVRRHRALVLQAAPGAGKTTRVPSALQAAGLAGEGDVVVLEPRRLAVRLAARRVAEEHGERVGETVGYQVRFDEQVGPKTRIKFATEGILNRRLLSDPLLAGVGVVVLDEFHERSLDADVALALLRRLQVGERPDLGIAILSATFDPAPVARFLGDAPVVVAPGREFEVRLEYAPKPDERPLEVQVAGAARRLLAAEPEGDLLVFLPGGAEIRRAAEACAPIAERGDVVILPLHGSLSPEEQDRAVRPNSKRKLILSTNVAETSVTIDGVVAVIDGGLARQASHSPWSGLPTLKLSKISRASAAQRAGRAGRTRPGVCVRLYTRHDHDARLAQDLPEVLRADLAETALALRAAGVRDLKTFPWFEAPKPEAVEAAEELLKALGAVEPSGDLSEMGRRMLRFPLHPRLARVLVEAQARGVGGPGCTLVALVGERDLRSRSRPPSRDQSAPSDPLELLEAFEQAAAMRFAPNRLRDQGIDPGAATAVERVRAQLERLIGSERKGTKRASTEATDRALQIALLAGYPDRVARRRRPRSNELILSGGGSATLSPQSSVRDAELMVTIDAEESRRPGQSSIGLVRSASAIEADWLLDLRPQEVREEIELRWNPEGERVEQVERLTYGALVLDEARSGTPDPERAAALLATAARELGARAFAGEGELDRLLGRLAFARSARPDAGLPEIGEKELGEALAQLCQGRTSFAEVRETGLIEHVLLALTPQERSAFESLSPDSIALRGRRTRIEYLLGQPPFIQARLQDFFGLNAAPRVGTSQVPLVLHLLAPNKRAVQVTTDLQGFWQRHYPALRKQLSRRYPRHAWPEDPLHPSPPRSA